MASEDDIVELLYKSGQIVSSSQTQRPTSVSDPHILRGSGSGGGEGENVPIPPPPQNVFIQEDEMATWLHHHHQEDDLYSALLYSGIIAPSQPRIPISLPPPTTQVRRAENFTNLARLRGNTITRTGPVLRDLTESCLTPETITRTFAVPGLSRKATEPIVVSLAPPPPPPSAPTEYSLIPMKESSETRPRVRVGVSQTFVVPGLGRKEKAVAIETKAEIEPIQIQPATETKTAQDREREERVETIEETGGSTTRKRSRDAEMHNLCEKKRRERINDRMRALKELMPRCNKSDKASMLDDAVAYMKSLQMQVQMMSSMMPAMYIPDMQGFMPQMAMGLNQPPYIPFPSIRPFPSQAHMAGLGPSYPLPRYPFPNIQAFDPSRFNVPPSHQPNPVLNQPQFPGYWNPYGHFVGPSQIQQPPPLHNQTITSQPSFGQASHSKEPEDKEKQQTDS